MKNIINQFKKYKEKYILFINEPEITLLIAGWIFIQLMGAIIIAMFMK